MQKKHDEQHLVGSRALLFFQGSAVSHILWDSLVNMDPAHTFARPSCEDPETVKALYSRFVFAEWASAGIMNSSAAWHALGGPRRQ